MTPQPLIRAVSRSKPNYLHHHTPCVPSFSLIYLVCISVKEWLQTHDGFQGIAQGMFTEERVYECGCPDGYVCTSVCVLSSLDEV